MTDTVTPEIRSRMMAAIKSKDTKLEIAIRRGLHALGFRYVLHSTRFKGKPDIVLPKHRAVIWINGCYWHGHDCGQVRPASTNRRYWSEKIEKNCARDARNQANIRSHGWRNLVIWECSTRRKGEKALAETIDKAASWLRSGTKDEEIKA